MPFVQVILNFLSLHGMVYSLTSPFWKVALLLSLLEQGDTYHVHDIRRTWVKRTAVLLLADSMNTH
jgi:hypothetical protein